MKMKFWGVTGSLPAPSCREAGFERAEFGGNTSCVEVRPDGWPEDRVAVFDVGSGARGLGADMARRSKPLEAHIFISHTHWDHVQGLPFFAPLYLPGSRLHFYGMRKTKGMMGSLEEVLAGQQNYPTFPRQLSQCPSFKAFKDLDPFGAPVELPGGCRVEYFELNHPDGCLGYVLHAGGKRVAYCTDTEHFSNTANPSLVRACRDVDLLYIDGQYTEEEYCDPKSPKVTWGHNTIWAAVREAKACAAKRLVVGHHDHFHDDTMLRRMEVAAKGLAKEMGYDPDRVWFAREGVEISV